VFYPAAVLAVAVIVTVILLIFVIRSSRPVPGFGADLRRSPVRDRAVALDAGQGWIC